MSTVGEVCESCVAESVRVVKEYLAQKQSVAQGTCSVTRGASQPQTVSEGQVRQPVDSMISHLLAASPATFNRVERSMGRLA